MPDDIASLPAELRQTDSVDEKPTSFATEAPNAGDAAMSNAPAVFALDGYSEARPLQVVEQEMQEAREIYENLPIDTPDEIAEGYWKPISRATNVITDTPPRNMEEVAVKLRLLADPDIGMEAGYRAADVLIIRQILGFLAPAERIHGRLEALQTGLHEEPLGRLPSIFSPFGIREEIDPLIELEAKRVQIQKRYEGATTREAENQFSKDLIDVEIKIEAQTPRSVQGAIIMFRRLFAILDGLSWDETTAAIVDRIVAGLAAFGHPSSFAEAWSAARLETRCSGSQ